MVSNPILDLYIEVLCFNKDNLIVILSSLRVFISNSKTPTPIVNSACERVKQVEHMLLLVRVLSDREQVDPGAEVPSLQY